MKKSGILIAFMAGLWMTSPLRSNAQFIVRERPVPPPVVVVRPAAPRPAYIWVDGEWRWSRRMHAYVWTEGRWKRPHKGRVWVPGHWVDVEDGSEWIPGHWARR